jgi:hypothetical protein
MREGRKEEENVNHIYLDPSPRHLVGRAAPRTPSRRPTALGPRAASPGRPAPAVSRCLLRREEEKVRDKEER